MSLKIKAAYGCAVLVPIFLGLLIWDVKGDIYELTGNMQIAQFMDREGEVVYPQDILFVERHLETQYLDKPMDPGSSLLIFAQRNPDLPNYSIYMKILSENPENARTLYDKIVADFQGQSKELIEGIRAERENQINSIKNTISGIEKFGTAQPQNLKDGEAFSNIYKQLVELKEKREFLQISLNENSMFNYQSLGDPSIKKKRDKSNFILSLLAGVLFLMIFLSYLVFRFVQVSESTGSP